MGVRTAVLKADRGTAEQVVEAVAQDELAERLPEHADDRAAAVVDVDAGAADFHDAAGQGVDHLQIELAGRVEAAGARRDVVGQDARAGDETARAGLAHGEVAAKRVVVIDVDALVAAIDIGAEFLGEDAIAQALGLENLRRSLGEAGDEARRVAGCLHFHGCGPERGRE